MAEKNPIAEPEKASEAQWSLSLIRASFSQDRMQYLEEPSKIVYQAKEGTDEEVFDALQWFGPLLAGNLRLFFHSGINKP